MGKASTAILKEVINEPDGDDDGDLVSFSFLCEQIPGLLVSQLKK